MRIFLVILALVSAAPAQTKIEKVLQATAEVTRFREAVIAPDGKHLAYVEALRNADNSESNRQAIYLVDLSAPGHKPRRVSAGDTKDGSNEHALAWSPDSTQLAFLSDRDSSGQPQLYVAGWKGPARRLTTIKGQLASPQWQPDGQTIAVLFTENAPRAAGPLEPAPRDAGVVEDKFYEQRLALVPVRGGAPRMLTPPDTYVYEYCWSPDSKALAYTAAKGNGDNNWWIAELYAVDAATAAVRHVAKPEQQIAVPRYSPDGQSIAFIGGTMSDEGVTGGDIYVVPAAGGTPHDVTPGRTASPTWLRWETNQKLLLAETVDGGRALAELNLANGETERLWRGDETITAGEDMLSVAADHRTSALIRSSWQQAPEVWTGKIGEWQQLTHANAQQTPAWGRSEKLHWQQDGASVEGWLIFPRGYDAAHQTAQRYPLVVAVHGGPASVKIPSWPGGFDPALLSATGYFVLMPNPRGSYGAGEAFTRANIKDFGYGDLRDILAGVDEVVKTYPVDPRRIGLTGWSYGGFMTMFGVTQTHRFRAAVAGAGISNWLSYYGQNLIDQWMLPYFGASVYDDPAVYARSSAMTYIKQVTTPTLVVVGDSDAECPAPQSYEFWHALKTLNVKTQLVVYPNEGHRFHVPEHQQDVMRRLQQWFDDNMPPS